MAKDKQVEALKVPPHSLEAERSVLGGLMLENNSWDAVIERLINKDFYTRAHQHIFSAMEQLVSSSQPIDLITLTETLEQNDQLDSVGGFAYLSEMAKNTPSTANILAYADIVRERAIIRSMIGTANKIADTGFNPQGRPSHELLDYAETEIFRIAESRIKTGEGPVALKDVLKKTIDKIDELYKTPHHGVTGVSTGFTDLDKMTSGLQSSDLIIVAARPSMGKTTFAMNLCENAALTQDKPALIFSLEMPSDAIMMRSLASLSRVDQTKIRTGQLDDDDWAKLSSSIGILIEKGKLYIDDASMLTPAEVRARSRRVAKEHGGLSMIMVDYLQLMTVPGMTENRTLEIAEISRSLKALAKELNVPVIALSQLNRSLEQRSDKRPVNSDLRESGAIEQDADLIMFIYRDEVYHDDTPDKGTAEVIIGKHRNGPIGKIRLTFQGQYSRFDNYAGPETFDY